MNRTYAIIITYAVYTHTEMVVVRIGAQIELVKEIVVVKIVAGRRGEITVKRPAVFQHQRVHDRNRD